MQMNTALVGLSAVALGTTAAGFVTGRNAESARIAAKPSHAGAATGLRFSDLAVSAGLATGMTALLGASVVMGSLFATAKPARGFGTAAGITSGVGIAAGAGFLLGTIAGSASLHKWDE